MTSPKISRMTRGAIVALVVLAGCSMLFPSVTPEDATNASFVRQAVPILHGRKIRGYEETKMLADLATATNRETVLRALMAQPQFIDQWSEVLVDDLHVQREGFQAQTSCYGAPLRAGSPTEGIAATVLGSPPGTAAAGGAYNMSDLVRSALVLDNLYPLYRAHLYAHTSTNPLALDDLQRRDILGAQFGEMYLNRQMACLTCHNSESSASGLQTGWNRTFPIQGLFEKALFGVSTGEPTRNAYAMFRGDERFGPLSPWGVQSCGTFKTTLPNDPQNAIAVFVQPQGQQFGVHKLQGLLNNGYQALKVNGLERMLPPSVQTTCDFCQANCQGNTLSVEQAANNAPHAAEVKVLFHDHCQSCHGGAGGLFITNGADWANDLIGVPSSGKPGETLVIPGNANDSYLIKKLTGSVGIAGVQMPAGGQPAFTAAQIQTVRDWINGLPSLSACQVCSTTDCGQAPQDLQGEPAFAYLVAARIVNNVWQEVFGTEVTIANYFPRHFEQRQVLWNLTEYNFLPNDWSLRDLLVRMMTSDMFNRVTPRSTAHATAYDLPPIFDPWTVFDPRVAPVTDPGYSAAANPQNHKNAMSEESYRYSARSLTNSVSNALGWPKPQRFPGGTYPDADLMRSIGMYFSEEQPGFQTPDFAGLLAWETVHGQCVNPNPANPDWISKVVVAINNWNPATMGGPLTVEDAAITMRDWLLGYGGLGASAPQGLGQTERDALLAFFGVASLSDPLTSVTGLETKLRKLCGMHLESPQFQLSGLVETGLGPKPRLRVCNTAECSYLQMCQAIAPAVNAQLGSGSTLLCGTDSVSVLTLPQPPQLVNLCPPGICGVLDKFVNKGCPIMNVGIGANPAVGSARDILTGGDIGGRCTPQAPACDPRCSRIDCCGGPLQRDLRPGDTMVAWADGGVVTNAEGVSIQRRGSSTPEPLRSGTRVGVGDLIALPPGSRMELRTVEGKTLRTPEKGMPRRDDGRPVLMMVSGDKALETRRAEIPPPAKPFSRERMLRARASESEARGEGGALISEERRLQNKYSPFEIALTEKRRQELLSEPKR